MYSLWSKTSVAVGSWSGSVGWYSSLKNCVNLLTIINKKILKFWIVFRQSSPQLIYNSAMNLNRVTEATSEFDVMFSIGLRSAAIRVNRNSLGFFGSLHTSSPLTVSSSRSTMILSDVSRFSSI